MLLGSLGFGTVAQAQAWARLQPAVSIGGVDPQSGVWWNPAEPGRGYALERQGNLISIGAYLYEANGAATWYAGLLTRQADGSYTGAISRFSGGQSLGGAYKAPTGVTPIANLTLTAITPTTGSLLLQPADGSAAKLDSVERFSFSDPAYAPSDASFQNGMWWAQAEGGRGYFVDVQDALAVLSSYMYDEAGQPVWYITNAAIVGGNAINGNLDQYAGGQTLSGPFKPPGAAGTAPGRVGFTALTPSTANLTLPNGRVVALTRFVFGQSASLDLYSVGDGFSSADSLLEMPYVASAVVSANGLCLGSACATSYSLAAFRLSATGQSFTLTNLQASNASAGSVIAPFFKGLSEGQTIVAGASAQFTLESPWTQGQSVDLVFGFTVQETGQRFQYAVAFRSN